MKDVFKENGFIKYNDDNKKLVVSVNNCYHEFKLETNVIYDIPNTDIRFCICSSDSNTCRDDIFTFFINKDFNINSTKNVLSPLRTFYFGLMKEPFKLVYLLDKNLKLETDDGYYLEVSIKNK